MAEIRSFASFRARPFLVNQIMRPVKAGRIVHAQLYTGPEGTGKRAAAKIAARALNCEGTGEKPCNECPSCLQFLSGNSKRLIEIEPEKNLIKVEVVRDLIEKIHLRPDSGYLCVIINHADRMNESAQNAFLKTLEEAPEYAVFFLITDRPSSLLPTVHSRCAAVRFAPLADETVREALAELGVDEAEAKEASRESGGSIGIAYARSTDKKYHELRNRALGVLKSVRSKANIAEAFLAIKGDKEQANTIIQIYESCAERLMRYQTGDASAADEDIKVLCQNGIRGDRLLNAVIRCAKRLNAHVAYQSAMEMLFFDMVSQEDLDSWQQ